MTKIGFRKVAFLIYFALNSVRRMLEKFNWIEKKITTVPKLDQISNNIKKLNIFSYAFHFIFPSQFLFFPRLRKGVLWVFLKLPAP